MDYDDHEDYRYGLSERQIRERMNRALRDEDEDDQKDFDVDLDVEDLEDEDIDD